MPFRFWNVILNVFGGLSGGIVLPIHVMRGGIRLGCRVVDLLLMSRLFSGLLAQSSERFAFCGGWSVCGVVI